MPGPYDTGDENGGGAGTGNDGSGGTPGSTPFSPTGFSIGVDLYESIQQVAAKYGVPAGYVASAIYYSRSGGFGTGKNEVTAAEITQMAQSLQGQAGTGSWQGALARVIGAGRASLAEQLTPGGSLDPRSVTSPRATPSGGGITAAQKSLNALVTPDDILNLYETYLGRAPENQGAIDGRMGRTYGEVLNEISGGKEAAQYRIKGDQINAIKGNWANSLWQQLLGRPPTNTEIMNIINNGWNQQQATTFLETQPYGTAKNTDGSPKTIGQVATIRDAVSKAFQKAGLTADEGTINDFITNNHPISNADAYVSQYIKQHGMVNPATYADVRKQLAQTLAGFGVNVNPNDIDPALLASAVAGNWTADQMTQAVGSRQAPGAPDGTTLAQYSTAKQSMDGIWKTYFPTVTMPQPYINQMMAMTPDQQAAFIGAMPSLDAQQAGVIVPVKTYTDAKLAAQKALSQWGAVGATPSAADLAYFAAHGFDAEAITKHYQTDPTVLASNPGAQYGLSREQYRLQRSQIEQSYSRDFAPTTDVAATKAKVNDPNPGGDAGEPDWLSAIFKSGQTPQQANAMFQDVFKRQGRAPTADEVGAYQSRHTETFGQTSQGSGGQGGTQPQLAGPATNRR